MIRAAIKIFNKYTRQMIIHTINTTETLINYQARESKKRR